jgi:hypothetical protein
MRMFRKLSLVVFAAVAVLALSASAASATGPGAVIVENPGEVNVTGENTIAIGAHTPLGFATGLRCANNWHGEVNADGHVSFDTVNIDPHPTGTTGNCSGMDDCGNDGEEFEGQIHERETGVPSEFGIDFHFCLSGQGGGLDGVHIEVECSMFDEEVHCDDRLFVEGTGIPISQSGFPVEVLGELFLDRHLGLTHG